MGGIVDETRWDEKAGLLYPLRFERVDNLGAYSIPSETGLLIPSGFDNNPAKMQNRAATHGRPLRQCQVRA